MNHIKSFFKEKGLYLFCLALVFAATAAGILALRRVVTNMSELTQLRKDALQEESQWTQPDTTVDNPASNVPKPTAAPSAAPLRRLPPLGRRLRLPLHPQNPPPLPRRPRSLRPPRPCGRPSP